MNAVIKTMNPSALMSEDQGMQLLLEQAKPVPDIEIVEISQALNRVLAETKTSQINVPQHDYSAMDGYAVNSNDIPHQGEVRLKVSQRIPAGNIGNPLSPGTAAQIFTGAPILPGADAIVIQEDCRRDNDSVIFRGPVKVGKNIRKAGEDIGIGTEILKPGIKICPQDIGLAASVGIKELSVYRRLKVAMFTTGDELVMPGQALGPGKIYNSNRYTLAGFLHALGCDVFDLGNIPDDLNDTQQALEEISPDVDLIITTGGVSVGEEDHVKAAVERLGQLELWRIALKPGKPLAYGKIGKAHFFGLPGNPVSLFVTFCIIARPFILSLQGRLDVKPRSVWAKAQFERSNPIKRREYLRARLESTNEGQNHVAIYPRQGSGILSSASWANSLVVVPENSTVEQGQMVNVIPLSELIS